MNQQKTKKLARWHKALEDYELVGEYNNGTHLRYRIGLRIVDVWPTTGKFRINNGMTMVAGNPVAMLLMVLEYEDEAPDGGQYQSEPQTMANVVQFKHFEWQNGNSPTALEQANTWLAEHAGSVRYVDVRIIKEPLVSMEEADVILVYKILTEL